jgi:hypothetical protein
METETLFFKDKVIHGDDVEIIFHKDYTHFFNIETFPIVKYTLLNCEDLGFKNFDNIDFHNDGAFVKTMEDNNHFVFEMTDMGGEVFQIVCEQIIIEELEYRKEDYIDLLKEMIKQRDDEYELANKYYSQLESLKIFLEKEMGIHERKLKQANWLPNDKRKVIEGELSGFRKVLGLLTNGQNAEI